MSFDAAIGRITQIVTLQQQLADPASAGGLPAAAAAAAAAAASLSGTAGDFASALASAQGGAGTGAAGATGTGTGAAGATGAGTTGTATTAAGAIAAGLGATSGLGTTAAGLGATSGLGTIAAGLGATAAGASNPQVAAMLKEADSLVGKPYIVGGGHSGWGSQAGYDCSGFVSAVLHAGGYLSSPQTTVTLPNQPEIASGPGQYVTIYDRALPGQSGHVIIDINGQFYESGGAHGSWGGGGGVEKIATPSASYLATFPTVLHPAGL